MFLAVGSASADPTRIQSKQAEARDVLAQIQLIDGELGKAVERYNFANLQLDRIQADLKANARHLVIARTSLSHARSNLSQRLVAIYVNGTESSAMEVLLGARNLDDLVDRLETIDRVGGQDARVVSEVRRFKAEVQARKVRLKKARAQQRRVVAARAAERESIEGQLAARQRLLASIKSEIAQLEAEERARQARLAAQARARLAQQRTLASQSQSQSQSQAQSPTEAAAPAQTEPAAPEASDTAVELEDVDTANAIVSAPPARYGGAVGIAMQYLGTPYRYGGADPSGFDCSGFIMYVFGQLGVSLPHHAASQYGMGVPVSRDQLQAGDLVFFNGLGHAGIYVGGGSFIHSPHTGDVVKISSMGSSWYASTYVGSRRIL